MEIAPDNSKAAVPDTVLQEINVSSGASTFGAAETPALGSQFPSPSLETRAVIPTSSSLYYTSFYPYTVENMSLALAESSTAPMNFFSSLPVTSVISCSSAAESQVSTSISHDSPCFNFDPEYCPPFSVSLPGTAACSSAFPSTFADASVGFQRCASSFGSAQADIRPVYASSESATAICVSSSRLQSTVQPQGTTAVMSPSLRILEGYCGDLVPASPSDSAVPENPSLLIVSDGTDDSTSLRLVDDSHDPTLLGVADELDDLSASHRHVPLHSAEIPTTVVELPPQSSITAEELSSLRIPSETIAETVHPLPTVGVVYSSAHSEPPVGASTDLSIERSSSLPPTRPPSASPIRGEKRQREADLDERTENPAKRSRKQCRAGNLKCGMETGRSVLLGPVPGLDCDICCVEPGFCRECTCILCCKTIVPDGGECNVVRCMQRPLAGGICGHGAHLECALESQMAGVVKKRGLDMEYLCRRCDRKTDLRELVTRLLEAVGNTVQGSVAEKCLQLALQIMQGTEHGGTGARVLESLVQAALRKVQSGVDIQEVFSDLRDQGIAAEAAKHQCLGRASSNGEDGSQQPEASLDQWLPSSGSPSSHPSPGTPSSFSSPIIRRNLSVNSPADGPEGADHGNHRGVDGHTGESGAAVRNPGSKFSSPASEPSSFKPSQARVSSHRGRAGSSSSDGNQEATCGSQAVARNGKFSVDESGPRSLHLGMKKSDHKGPIAGAGAHGDEHCRSCGVRRPACPGLEVTSSLKFPNAEDGGDKSHCFSPAGRKGELTPQNPSRHTHDAERETNHGSERSQCTSAAVVSLEGRSRCNVLGVSLRLLDEKCQQQVQSVLQKLRQAQQMEFLRAQERLIAQKDTVLKQYELLETARNQYDGAVVSSSYHLQDFDHLMLKLSNQLAKASEERQSFEKMFKIAQGFGKLSKEDLSKLFGWATEREVESHD